LSYRASDDIIGPDFGRYFTRLFSDLQLTNRYETTYLIDRSLLSISQSVNSTLTAQKAKLLQVQLWPQIKQV